jgi:hypothetical protein
VTAGFPKPTQETLTILSFEDVLSPGRTCWVRPAGRGDAAPRELGGTLETILIRSVRRGRLLAAKALALPALVAAWVRFTRRDLTT